MSAAEAWEYLTGVDDEPDYEAEPPPVAGDEAIALEDANRHLRHIHRIRGERAWLQSMFEAEVRRIQMRLASRLEQLDKREAWHAKPVEELHRALLARDDKRKTISLPNGTLKARAQQPEWLYRDEDSRGPSDGEDTTAFVEWAQESHPDLIASRVFTLKVPQSAATAAWEALLTLDNIPADSLELAPAAPDKNVVKRTLVKNDERGKPLVYGVDPATGEHPPGLFINEREPAITIDTDVDDDAPKDES